MGEIEAFGEVGVDGKYAAHTVEPMDQWRSVVVAIDGTAIVAWIGGALTNDRTATKAIGITAGAVSERC